MRKISGLLLVMIVAIVSVSAQTRSQVKHRYRKAGVVRVGPATLYIKEGLTTEEVVRLLGEPANRLDRLEDGAVLTTYEFPRGAERVLIAEFKAGILVNYRIETRAVVALVAQ